MDFVPLLLRVVHIVCGVYWAGALLFVATFLEPGMRAAGPDGAKVMSAMMQRRLLDVMPVIALLTILTGVDLYRRASGGFNPAWIHTGYGMSMTLGALAAIVAFTIGVGVMRPAAMRVRALAPAVQQLPEGPEKAAQVAAVERLRGRSAAAGRWVATLLGLSVVGMAAARYL